jgi:hypothetical protein
MPENIIDKEQHILTFFVAEVLARSNISHVHKRGVKF